MMIQTDFEKRLSRQPNDWTTRAVYADWLDENGDSQLARAQRWMAAGKHHPKKADFRPALAREGIVWTEMGPVWEWWSRQGATSVPRDPYVLPGEVFAELRGQALYESTCWECLTRVEAEHQLAMALARLEVASDQPAGV